MKEVEDKIRCLPATSLWSAIPDNKILQNQIRQKICYSFSNKNINLQNNSWVQDNKQQLHALSYEEQIAWSIAG